MNEDIESIPNTSQRDPKPQIEDYPEVCYFFMREMTLFEFAKQHQKSLVYWKNKDITLDNPTQIND